MATRSASLERMCCELWCAVHLLLFCPTVSGINKRLPVEVFFLTQHVIENFHSNCTWIWIWLSKSMFFLGLISSEIELRGTKKRGVNTFPPTAILFLVCFYKSRAPMVPLPAPNPARQRTQSVTCKHSAKWSINFMKNIELFRFVMKNSLKRHFVPFRFFFHFQNNYSSKKIVRKEKPFLENKRIWFDRCA